MRKFLHLSSAQRFGDFALLLLRVFVGLFLIWGVWDNITDPARMREFVEFLRKFHFPSPELLAPPNVANASSVTRPRARTRSSTPIASASA